MQKVFEGTHGFEPWTYRTAADCSTTELYPPVMQPHPLFDTFPLRLTDETFANFYTGYFKKALPPVYDEVQNMP